MGKLAKLLARLENTSADSSWDFDDAVYLLEHFHFSKAGGRGSHQVFQNDTEQKTIVLAKHGNKIKSGYIRTIRKAIYEK